MSAYVLLNLFNKLGKKTRCKFNKFSNTGARIQILFIIMSQNRILLANFALKSHDFAIRKRDIFLDVNA